MIKKTHWGSVLAQNFGVTAIALSATFMIAPVAAQTDASDLLAQYREMLADGNPADLYEDAGAELWVKKMGSKNRSLAKTCNLGLGVGVVKGASASLPRYFKDTDRVQDLESRLLTCMERGQGIDPKTVINGRWRKERKNMEAIVTYVVAQSKGLKVRVSTKHPKEQAMYEAGKQAFFFRGGPFDFSCATCHSEKGKRIRLQDLPDITQHEGAVAGWGSWPAYRVGNGQLWTMQHRIEDCFRQQRMPHPIYASDLTVALSMYMAKTANGGIIKTPAIKR